MQQLTVKWASINKSLSLHEYVLGGDHHILYADHHSQAEQGSCCLFILLLNHEDVSSMLLQNISKLLYQITHSLIPGSSNLQNALISTVLEEQ
jgi:hypothetical protein